VSGTFLIKLIKALIDLIKEVNKITFNPTSISLKIIKSI